jgi:hypothetical protein
MKSFTHSEIGKMRPKRNQKARRIDCKYDSLCLERAAKQGKKEFSCGGCNHYTPFRLDPERSDREILNCRLLICYILRPDLYMKYHKAIYGYKRYLFNQNLDSELS